MSRSVGFSMEQSGLYHTGITFMPRLLYFILLLLPLRALASFELPVAQFSLESVTSWQVKHFVGRTQYVVVPFDGQRVLKATSNDSATIITKPIRIDLEETPYLNWSWRVEDQLSGINETTKSGDDFAARIYLVIGDNLLNPATKAINYVWSSNQPRYSRWSNPFAGEKVQMIAVRGATDTISQWRKEKRNVYQDLINVFGDKGSEHKNRKAYRYLDAIAIMTDSDNSGRAATAYYGDIFFSTK